MIPTFPQFKRLELSDRREIEDLTQHCPPYSDYNFTNLWCWDLWDQTVVSQLKGHLIVRSADYLTGKGFYSFIGPTNELASEIAGHIMGQVIHRREDAQIALVPEELASALDKDRFRVAETPDAHDYILDVHAISSFSGSQYREHRSKANRFVKRFIGTRAVPLDLTDCFIRREIEHVTHQWEANRHRPVPHERRALDRLFHLVDCTPFLALGVYAGNVPVAYHIAERVHDGFAIGHFTKADVTYRGSSDYVLREVARMLAAEGCRFLNFEEDMGLPGLRSAKQRLRPVHFLRKYTVRPHHLPT